MVLKNLFSGQQWRNRHREYAYGHGERVRCMGRETWTHSTISKTDSQWELSVWLGKLKKGL